MNGLLHKIKCGKCAYRKQCHTELREVQRLQEENESLKKEVDELRAECNISKEPEITQAEVQNMLYASNVECTNCIAKGICEFESDLSCEETIYLALKFHFKN